MILRHTKPKITELQEALVVYKNVLKFDVHVSELSFCVHCAEALDQLQTDAPHKVHISDNHPLPLLCHHTCLVLSSNPFADKLKEIIIGAVLKNQEVSDINCSIDFNWLLTFKRIDVDNVWAIC